MILFQSSLFLFLLGNVLQHVSPQKINPYFGFRTKKSMKNQKNWEISQKAFSKYMTKIFSYSCLSSIPLLIIDILFITFQKDTLLTYSLIVQSLILVILLFTIYLKVNKKMR